MIYIFIQVCEFRMNSLRQINYAYIRLIGMNRENRLYLYQYSISKIFVFLNEYKHIYIYI